MVQDTLESLLYLVENDAEGVAKFIRELQLIAQTQKEEAKRLAELAKKNEERIKNILRDVQSCMYRLGLKNLQAGAYQFKITKGREVVEVDLDRLPSEYKKAELELDYTKIPDELKEFIKNEKHIDKNELKKLLKEGKTIEGVTLVQNPDSISLK